MIREAVDWSALRYFRREEFGPEANQLDAPVVYALDELREALGHPIRIHVEGLVSPRAATPGSQHPLGRAIDCHAEHVALLDFWLAASCLPAIRGLGLYPHWTHPGLHVDTRATAARALWWQDERGVYQSLTADALRQIGGV